MNNRSAFGGAPEVAATFRRLLPAALHFPPVTIPCEKEVSGPFHLFMRNKVNKKVGNLLYIRKVFLLKNIYSPCISLLNSSRVAVFSLSFTTFLRASVSLRSMLRSTNESMYSFFFSMSVA